MALKMTNREGNGVSVVALDGPHRDRRGEQFSA